MAYRRSLALSKVDKKNPEKNHKKTPTKKTKKIPTNQKIPRKTKKSKKKKEKSCIWATLDPLVHL